jgi:benzodiazapine receptor
MSNSITSVPLGEHQESRPPDVGILRQAVGLALSIAICAGAAAVGGALTSLTLQDWYQQLAKPTWNPPNWVFGPVWSVLYFMMAVAAWLVWRTAGWKRGRTALSLFALQLALNVAWSGCFFALRSPGLAVVDIGLLWLALAATIIAFWRHSRLASLMLAPYLAWSSFAAVLNATIWQLN